MATLDLFSISFIDSVDITFESADSATISTPLRNVTIKELTPGIVTALNTLHDSGLPESALTDAVFQADGFIAAARLGVYLEYFHKRNLLTYTVKEDETPLLSCVPISPAFLFNTECRVEPTQEYILSRFMLLRREGRDMICESPLAHARLIIEHPNLQAALSHLAGPLTPGGFVASCSSLSASSLEAILALLLDQGFVCEADQEGNAQEDENTAIRQWEFHDLLFHTRSRSGRHENPLGGTYRFMNRIEPLPVVKHVSWPVAIDLYQPDINALQESDAPFTRVLEERRSVRDYATEPLTVRQLGEFLYRAARIKKVNPKNPETGALYESCQKNYPGGGAAHELELYLTVAGCEGLQPGLYYYHPQEHRLYLVSTMNEHCEQLLSHAAAATAHQASPQVLITITTRFQRLSWKYASIAYSVSLKNAGALLQTMYLVATAMELSPCAVGSGNSDLFANATNLDYYKETSIGEFLLGNKLT